MSNRTVYSRQAQFARGTTSVHRTQCDRNCEYCITEGTTGIRITKHRKANHRRRRREAFAKSIGMLDTSESSDSSSDSDESGAAETNPIPPMSSCDSYDERGSGPDPHLASPPPRRPLGDLSNRVESSQQRKDTPKSAKEARCAEKGQCQEQEEDEARERELKDPVERPPGRFSLSRFLLGEEAVEGHSPPPDVAVFSYPELLMFQVSAFPVIKSNLILAHAQRTGGGTIRTQRLPCTGRARERKVVLVLSTLR